MKNNTKLLREKSREELNTQLFQERSKLAKLVLEKNSGKLKDVRSIFHQRKEIARILTILKQKEFSHE